MAAPRPSTLIAAWLSLTLGLAVRPALGQNPGLAARIDSIRSSTDTVALRRLVAAGRSGPGPASRLTRGFAAMRLFTINGAEDDARAARAAFETARDSTPDDPWAWYGIGVTWAEGPELNSDPPRIVTIRAFQEAIGSDPGSRAIHALRRALDVDPDFTPAATALVPLALTKHDDDAIHLARAALARARSRGDFSFDALDALARADRYLGDTGDAVDAARRVATMSGGDPAALYDLAVALFADGRDDDGAVVWNDAVDGLDDALADRVHEDLRPIADEWEEDRWARLDADGRREWIRDFWDTRAALAGVTAAERIGDHYRRLDTARRRYYRRSRWGAPPRNALLLERPDLPFDDRGLIYVRHGEPWDIVSSIGTENLRNESWVYRTPEGGYRMMHFFQYGSIGGTQGVDGESGGAYRDYILVHVLPCGAWTENRFLYDRRLTLLRCNAFDQRAISAEVRRDAVDALRSDSDAPDFERDLPFVYDLFTFRGPAGRTDLVAGVVLPAAAVPPVPAWQGHARDFDLSLIVVDTMFGRVARADTLLRLIQPDSVPSDSVVRFTLSLPVTPGEAQAQRLVVADGFDALRGRLAGRGIDVPDYSGTRLMVSDIVLAEPDSGGAFRRGETALALVPTREFPGGAFRTYYEVYNLTPDSSYSTEIVVEKAGGGIGGFVRGLFGGGPEVRLRFDDTAAPVDGLSPQLRRVDTSLGPGDYRIRVRVTDRATGRTAEKERVFTVVG